MEAFYVKKNLKTLKRERKRQVHLLDESQKKNYLPPCNNLQRFGQSQYCETVVM